ncbi:methylenetetrahydrofolate reductase [NAD(P)H] [Mariniluteicoccus endophyticus]
MTQRASITEDLVSTARPMMSFEFFPPRNVIEAWDLQSTVLDLQDLAPDFVAVTYGANGSNRGRTVETATALARRHGVRVMGHLTCTDQSRAELEAVIDEYAEADVEHVLAIRGDPVAGDAVWRPHPEGLANATELVELVKSRGDFCVGVAAFPHVHPEGSAELDARILKEKCDAGAEFAITQLLFDADAYARLVERSREVGCDIPIWPGIMPLTSLRQVARFEHLAGAPLPAAMLERVAAAGDDPSAVRAVGLDLATELCERLVELGAPGLHFFTLNRSRATREIYERLVARGVVDSLVA